jgi:asparagine synthase (glutamine-hydrolysing)
MCGINLIINTSHKPVSESLQSMQKATQYRGPDASGVFEHADEGWQIGLGANRLQVVDKDSKSNQPLISPCSNYILAYNGEVYNHQHLKNILIGHGYQFSTRSDTEVVLYWLQEFGVTGLESFKGMFALVFINLKENEVTIARDRHGIKPLFYCQAGDQLIVSSSIIGLEAAGAAKLSLNQSAVVDYLAYRHVLGNTTFYQEVQAQEPGQATVYDKMLSAKKIKIKPPAPFTGSSLATILGETVSLFYDAKNPPGLLLSGGVDSTLLLAVLSEDLGVSGVNTYTLAIGDDSKWAQQAARQYQSRHHEIKISVNILERIDEFLQFTDQPVADHGALATWLVAEEAAKNGNVLLSGAGADELFGGYNRHRAYYYYLNHKQRVLAAKTSISKIGLQTLFPNGVKQFLYGVNEDEILTYHNFLLSYAVKEKPEIEGFWRKEISINYNMVKAMEFDRKNYLVADVLAITDNATMQHGIETRVPYLYDDIVGLANTISINDKMTQRGKGPLKKCLAGYGGMAYNRRKKQGFGLPMSEWLQDKNSFWLWEFLLKDSPIFEFVSKTMIYNMLGLHRQGKIDYSMQLWSILVLERWLRKIYQ